MQLYHSIPAAAQLATIGTNIGNVLRGAMYEQPQRRFDNRRILQQMAIEQTMREHQIQQDQQRMLLAQNADARAAVDATQRTTLFNEQRDINKETLGAAVRKNRLAGEAEVAARKATMPDTPDSEVTRGILRNIGASNEETLGSGIDQSSIRNEGIAELRRLSAASDPTYLDTTQQRDKALATAADRVDATRERTEVAEKIAQARSEAYNSKNSATLRATNLRFLINQAMNSRDLTSDKSLKAVYEAEIRQHAEELDRLTQEAANTTGDKDTESYGDVITLGRGENTVKLRPKNHADAANMMRNKGGR